jgi:hypothetical protein
MRYDNCMSSPTSKRQKFLRVLLRTLTILIVGYLLLIVIVRPSNNRDWSPDTERTASAVFIDNSVKIRNVRNAQYRSTTDFDVHWEDRTYDLQKLESVWFIVEPFSDWRGPAHTFLSFGFGNSEYIAISVEIRKEKGESFSPVAGLLRQYELIYVVGDERDLIGTTMCIFIKCVRHRKKYASFLQACWSVPMMWKGTLSFTIRLVTPALPILWNTSMLLHPGAFRLVIKHCCRHIPMSLRLIWI